MSKFKDHYWDKFRQAGYPLIIASFVKIGAV